MPLEITDARTCTVLVAEDDDDLREGVRLILENDGFDTLGASDGAEALAVLKESRPDFVLLDLNMPIVTGLDFLRVKAEDAGMSNIPVVAITGEELSGPPPGVVAVLSKPFDLDRFLGLVWAE